MTDSARLQTRKGGRLVGAPMPSFREISNHFPVLLIDAASTLIQVGLIRSEASMTWETSTEESGIAVFAAVEKLNVDFQQLGAYVFCDGPGSTLGIRTVAMALRVWNILQPRPVFAYSSLALVAFALGRTDVAVIADARRDLWHRYRLGAGLERVAAGELGGELAMPENFRHWSPLPGNVALVPYRIADTLPRIWTADILRPTEAPDAYLPEEPSYVTWTAQVHQKKPA